MFRFLYWPKSVSVARWRQEESGVTDRLFPHGLLVSEPVFQLISPVWRLLTFFAVSKYWRSCQETLLNGIDVSALRPRFCSSGLFKLLIYLLPLQAYSNAIDLAGNSVFAAKNRSSSPYIQSLY